MGLSCFNALPSAVDTFDGLLTSFGDILSRWRHVYLFIDGIYHTLLSHGKKLPEYGGGQTAI